MKTDLGTFRGANNPSQVLSETRAFGWKLWTAFLAVNALQALGWLGWMQ
ncbi:hypothetical protein ACLJYM_06265 [Rhizobium giardinii]